MGDWAATASELATGAGTLVLAVATFAAVRSANRSARLTEQSMRASMRPVLMHSRFSDPTQKFAFADGKWVGVLGGGAAAEAAEGAVYLAISVRNAGTGMAILHGWRVAPGRPPTDMGVHPPLDEFTAQTRDMYVAPDDVGFWQGALRDPLQDLFAAVAAEVKAQGQLCVDLLYGDFEGGQRVISRFNLLYREASQLGHAGQAPGQRPAEGRWLASVVRHWNVDRPDPR
ncbi:MAG TPA: hypothetical protein VK586_22290 [Streptosporangiaceae bacterium]|nr:hypothetical protein [Streptosporangiaceae bacterium]